MWVFLVQHGLSRPKTEDPEKELSEEGRDGTMKIAGMATIWWGHLPCLRPDRR